MTETFLAWTCFRGLVLLVQVPPAPLERRILLSPHCIMQLCKYWIKARTHTIQGDLIGLVVLIEIKVLYVSASACFQSCWSCKQWTSGRFLTIEAVKLKKKSSCASSFRFALLSRSRRLGCVSYVADLLLRLLQPLHLRRVYHHAETFALVLLKLLLVEGLKSQMCSL